MFLAPPFSVRIVGIIRYFASRATTVFVAEIRSILDYGLALVNPASLASTMEFAQSTSSGRCFASFGSAEIASSMSVTEVMWVVSSRDAIKLTAWVVAWKPSSMESAMRGESINFETPAIFCFTVS